MKISLLVLFAIAALWFKSCDSKKAETNSDSSSKVSSVMSLDTTAIDSSFVVSYLNPDKSNQQKSVLFEPIVNAQEVKDALQKNVDMDKEIAKIGGIDLTNKSFTISLSDFEKFYSSIPNDGYLGVAYGVKKNGASYKGLTLGLFSLDSKYQDNPPPPSFISLNGFTLADTTNFKEVKRKLYTNKLNEFNPKGNYDKAIFPKLKVVKFFKNNPSFPPGSNVYLYFIYDRYNTSFPFPNLMVSNIPNLSATTDFTKLAPTAVAAYGNKGESCCPPGN